jgi:large subunit ribosomal protein L4
LTLQYIIENGKEVESLKVDESVFGGVVRHALIKQAVVMYQANKRIGTAATKQKSLVEGSTRKLYKQKGTGNARMGQVRTPSRVAAVSHSAKRCVISAKICPKSSVAWPAIRRFWPSCRGHVVVVDELNFDAPKTKDFARVLGNLKINRSCLVAVKDRNENLIKSVRNVPKVELMQVADLNAGSICNRVKMLFTKDAFLTLLNREQNN